MTANHPDLITTGSSTALWVLLSLAYCSAAESGIRNHDGADPWTASVLAKIEAELPERGAPIVEPPLVDAECRDAQPGDPVTYTTPAYAGGQPGVDRYCPEWGAGR